MNIISIIGCNGYIGQHLTFHLKQRNNTLWLFDVHPQNSLGQDDNYEQLNLKGELSETAKHKLQHSNYIYFFSGLTGTYKSIVDYADFININELGLLKILDSIKNLPVKPKIIFPSTRLVYKGQSNRLLKETDEMEFKTIYALNKYACEQYLKIYNNLFDIQYCVFRICVPYGNLIDSNLSYGTMAHFINRAKNQQNILLYGDGQAKRTFTHIGDLITLLVKGAESNVTNNKVYNIGSNDHLSLLTVANLISQKFDTKVELLPFPKIDELIESGDTIFDGSKLIETLSYTYQYSFKNWISEY